MNAVKKLESRLREVEELAAVCSYKPDREKFAAELDDLRHQLGARTAGNEDGPPDRPSGLRAVSWRGARGRRA